MMRIFGSRTLRPAPARRQPAPKFFRPRLENLEDREVPATLPGPALLGAPVVSGVNVVGVTGDVLELVANVTTPGGMTQQVPLTLDGLSSTSTTEILELHVGEIDLNVLGLQVETSEICLDITAQTGPGRLLGNLLANVAGLLDQGLDIGQVLSNLSVAQLTTLTNGLAGVVNGALRAVGSPLTAANGGASVTGTGATQVLNLSVGPVDLNLLGLRVQLDNCEGGPVTVDISAQPGAGNLLGNLISGLAGLLDRNAAPPAVLAQINRIANNVRALVVASANQLNAPNSLFPLRVTGIELTGVTNGVLQFVAHVTTASGRALPDIPFTLTNTTPNSTTPILDLRINALDLNILGLRLQTSDICLRVTAESGSGNLLGNLLANIARLLDGGATFQQIQGGLTPTQANLLNTGLSGLLNGAFRAVGSPRSAALGGASMLSQLTDTTQILRLALGPVDLNLLGLVVELDDCADGPVTVTLSAERGPGNLLGNLLSGLARLLDAGASSPALLQQINRILGAIRLL